MLGRWPSWLRHRSNVSCGLRDPMVSRVSVSFLMSLSDDYKKVVFLGPVSFRPAYDKGHKFRPAMDS